MLAGKCFSSWAISPPWIPGICFSDFFYLEERDKDSAVVRPLHNRRRSDHHVFSDLFLSGSKLCSSFLKFSCPALLMWPRSVRFPSEAQKASRTKAVGVWSGQLFSFPVAPLVRERLWGVRTSSRDCYEVSHIVSREWIKTPCFLCGCFCVSASLCTGACV